MREYCDVLVIGGGPAGIAAAAGARGAGADRVILVERNDELGGILLQCVHSGFGSVRYKRDLPGPAYAARVIREAEASGFEVRLGESVLDLTPGLAAYACSARGGFVEYRARAVVLAMGCRERTRPQVGIAGDRPAGVLTAGAAQRMVNVEGWMPGSRFVVLGSGDIGMIMARRLVIEGAKVEAVLEARPYLTGLRRNYVQCLEDFGVPLELSSTVTRVIGRKRVEAVEVARVDGAMRPVPGTERIIPCDALLLSVGLIPENELSRGAGVELDPLSGGPLVDDLLETSVPGIFAAGNVCTIHDLVDRVSEAGALAGRSAALRAREQAKPGAGAPATPDDAVPLAPGDGIASIVPQRFSPARALAAGLRLSFRAREPQDGRVRLELRSADGLSFPLAKLPYARPAEMVIVDAAPAQLVGIEGSRGFELRMIGEGGRG